MTQRSAGTQPAGRQAPVIAARLGTLEASTISLEGDESVAFAELHAVGIAFPAAVVSELELNGYVIERVYDNRRLIGVRLLQPEPPAAPASR